MNWSDKAFRYFFNMTYRDQLKKEAGHRYIRAQHLGIVEYVTGYLELYDYGK